MPEHRARSQGSLTLSWNPLVRTAARGSMESARAWRCRLAEFLAITASSGCWARAASGKFTWPRIHWGTTLSRATGEVGVSASDEALPKVARHPRWPLLALGGLVGIGLALFLLVRPSHGPAPREVTGSTGVAVPATSAAHSATPQPPSQQGAAVSVPPSVPDAGAAAVSSATAPPTRKPLSAASAAARTASAAKSSPPATERRHQVGKKKADDEWELH